MGKVVPCLIPYKSIFYLIFLIKIKLVFNQIKSCLVWKFVLNPGRHCSLGPDPALFFPGRPTCSHAAHARRPLPYSRMALDTSRPAPVSTDPTQLLRCRAPFSPCLHMASPAPDPPLPLTRGTKPALPRLPFALLRHRSHRELHCRLLWSAQDSPPEYPPPLLRPPVTSLAVAGHGGPSSTLESRRSTAALPSSVSSAPRVVLLHLVVPNDRLPSSVLYKLTGAAVGHHLSSSQPSTLEPPHLRHLDGAAPPR
jgi:hypothetical protein